MPNFKLKNQPKYTLVTIDTDIEIDKSKLSEILSKEQGINLCIRSKTGHEKRGGYFFCIEKIDNNHFKLLSIESDIIVENINIDTLIKLINHASGLAFDQEMLHFCQNEINFRTD